MLNLLSLVEVVVALCNEVIDNIIHGFEDI